MTLKNYNCKVLVIVETFSRYLTIIRLNNGTQEEILDNLTIHFLRFGFPKAVASDNEFDTQLFKKMSEKFLIKQYLTKAYTPNSLVERYVGLTKETFKKLMTELDDLILKEEIQLDLEEIFELIQYTLNTRINSTLGTSPFKVFFGREPNHIVDYSKYKIEEKEFYKELQTHLQKILEFQVQVFPAILAAT
jgi:IS30 family transposase